MSETNQEDEDGMELDDGMEIDETVHNATIIENKELSDTLSSVQSHKDTSLDTDVEVIDTPNKESSVVTLPPNDVVVLDDDDEQTVKETEPKLTEELQTPTKDCEDVIDLVSKKTTSANSKCINYACTSGVGMATATGLCLTFYRVKSKSNKKREVCQECFENALLHFNKLTTALQNKELLLNIEIPIRNDLVEIDDSDSEEEQEDEMLDYFSEENFQVVNEHLDDVINESIIKYNTEWQFDISMDYLKNKGKTLAEQFIEVDQMINDCRKRLDTVHHDLYSEFQVQFEHITPLEIMDLNHSYVGSNTFLYPSGDSRNLRKTKPVSYVESDDLNFKSSSPIVVNDATKEMPVEPVEVPLDLPPKGKVEKPPLIIGEVYYAVRFLTMGSWMRVHLTNFVKPGQNVNGTAATETMYCVLMESKQQSKYPPTRILSGKEIAYAYPSTVQLEVGARVIAAFKESTDFVTKNKKETFYPGVVAEPLLPANRYRYLIFFDDGYAQYVSYKMVHLIYQASKNVWEDMHIDSRPFIKKYLESYPERPMVMLRKNQKVRAEYNGKWWTTTVINIDCSLVQMHFDSSNRIEWIYRGSTRLNPMFKEQQAATNRQIRSRGTSKFNKSGPYVQYTRNDNEHQGGSARTEQEPPEVRSVARKSTSMATVPFLPVANERQTINLNQAPSKVVYFTPKEQTNTDTLFVPHTCSPRCKEYITYDLSKLGGYNPLSKPILCGWNRVTYKKGAKREINYKAPCGRFLRGMSELHMYLRLTESEMTVDMFDFDFWVHCLAEFVLERNSTIKKDMSDGLEKVAIPIVNYVDNDPNPFKRYSNKRAPKEGVHLNLDPEFLCGCDCEDDCVDKEKCQCWQLTLTGLPYLGKNASEFVGYSYRRLPEPVITGIYECNSRCKCASTCLNRVVQNPLQLKLQVFKTINKGWGIRCLNDIPQGAFICIYAGSMLTEQMANEGGKNYGDEYLAELDYIEVVEKMKEDYEEEAVASEDDEKTSSKSQPDDSGDEEAVGESFGNRKKGLNEDDDFVPHMFLPKGKENGAYRSRLRKRTVDDNEKSSTEKDTKSEGENDEKKVHLMDDDETVMISDDEDNVHEPSSFNPKSHSDLEDARPSIYKSVRELYGKDECVYVMDAKVSGNIGRFLNHSCNPNVFVQNVFVDTHDLRFPWVAFFALTYIRAGTELTWNYNYDVGSVPGKILYCHCASDECRGRLL